jgi:glycosyltransferase involved in cell wall biosynthesis
VHRIVQAHAGRALRVAVILPCYRVGGAVSGVVRRIPESVERIYVVDDGCPEESGRRVTDEVADPRVRVLRNERNLGVGGAVKRGYAQALEDGADIVVKIDGDGQMDPEFLPQLIRPIVEGRADYAKGNRFALASRIPRRAHRAGTERAMPPVRRVGNNILSFLHKAVTGYWNILDPTNGYTAVHRTALAAVDLDAVADGYFFETDMLFQLNLAEAVVADVPLPATYGDEKSSLRVRNVLFRFPSLFMSRLARRIWVKYFLHDFNVASLELALGLPLLLWGLGFGGYRWVLGALGAPNTAGTVMLAALPFSLGFQLLLSAVSYDIVHVPRVPLSRRPPDG